MKLFATDLDGTIVHEVDKVEKASIDAIKELQKNGVLVAVSTGRIFSGVKFLKENFVSYLKRNIFFISPKLSKF